MAPHSVLVPEKQQGDVHFKRFFLKEDAQKFEAAVALYEELMQGLEDVRDNIAARNSHDEREGLPPFNSFNPDWLECSVSL